MPDAHTMKTKNPTAEEIRRLEEEQEKAARRFQPSGRFERRRSDRAMRPQQVSRRAGAQGGEAGFLTRPLSHLLTCFAIVALAFVLLASRAAGQMTVTGRVKNAAGVLQPGTNVTFYPISTPLVISEDEVVTSSPVSTNADGAAYFAVPLLRGDYRVVYGNWSRDAFIISVTNTTGTASIGTLVKSRLTFVRRWIPGTNAWSVATALLSDELGNLLTDESSNFLSAD